MTKKEFKERIRYQKMTGAGRENDIGAVYFDWKSGDIDGKIFVGYKYCVYGRTERTKKDELIDALYKVVMGLVDDTPWYIQLVIAQNDIQRFKLPMTGSALRHLIKYEKPVTV